MIKQNQLHDDFAKVNTLELKKVIKSCKINSEYQEFVDQFMLMVNNLLGEEVRSIYMCGSIPKGMAQPYKSDADFTIVCNNLIANLDKDNLDKIKSELLNEYPFITKIDTILLTVEDVKNKPLEWGFWIKIICCCIQGKDLGEEVPKLTANTELILNLSSNVDESINKLKDKLNDAKDGGDIRKIIRGYSKRLLRGLYTLILDDVGEWQDDIKEMKNLLNKHMKDKRPLINKLYLFYINQDCNKVEFESCAEEASGVIYNRLEQLATLRQS